MFFFANAVEHVFVDVFSCQLVILLNFLYKSTAADAVRVCVFMCAAGRVIDDRNDLDWWLVRDDNQVAVYSLSDYRLLRHIHLPRLQPIVHSDMTDVFMRLTTITYDIVYTDMTW